MSLNAFYRLRRSLHGKTFHSPIDRLEVSCYNNQYNFWVHMMAVSYRRQSEARRFAAQPYNVAGVLASGNSFERYKMGVSHNGDTV